MPLGPIIAGAAKAVGPAVATHLLSRRATRGPRRRAEQQTRAIEEEIEGMRDMSEDFMGMFREQWNFWRDNFQDVDIAMLDEAMEMRERGPDMGRVSADVAGAVRRAGEAQERHQRRFGIDPTSGAAIAGRGDLAREHALLDVGARAQERRRHEQDVWDRLGTVSALGRQHAGMATQFAGLGTGLRQNVLSALTGEREQHLTDAEAAAGTVGRVAGAIPWDDIFRRNDPRTPPIHPGTADEYSPTTPGTG